MQGFIDIIGSVVLDFIIQVYKKVINSTAFLTIYSAIFRSFIRFQNWLKFGRHYRSSLDPLKILWIDPRQVEYKVKPSFWQKYRSGSPVIDGDWDLNNKIKHRETENQIYLSLKLRFEKGMAWPETPLYKISRLKIDSGRKTWHGCRSIEELRQRTQFIDDLYQEMKTAGYCAQADILKEINDIFDPSQFKKFNLHKLSNHTKIKLLAAPELNSVLVNIDRYGNFLLDDGQHRLYLAQILKIKMIPVRIMVRHKKWQEKRDLFHHHRNQVAMNREHVYHPDLALTSSESQKIGSESRNCLV